jgi:hypothetical protein
MAFAFGNAVFHGIEQVLDDELGWKEKHLTNGVGLPANYPALLALTRSSRAGLPASMTRFADTAVSTGRAVSTGVDESRNDSFAHQNLRF